VYQKCRESGKSRGAQRFDSFEQKKPAGGPHLDRFSSRYSHWNPKLKGKRPKEKGEDRSGENKGGRGRARPGVCYSVATRQSCRDQPSTMKKKRKSRAHAGERRGTQNDSFNCLKKRIPEPGATEKKKTRNREGSRGGEGKRAHALSSEAPATPEENLNRGPNQRKGARAPRAGRRIFQADGPSLRDGETPELNAAPARSCSRKKGKPTTNLLTEPGSTQLSFKEKRVLR